MAWLGGEQKTWRSGRTTVALESGLRRTLKTWGVSLQSKRVGIILFSKFHIHVVHTPGPVNPVDDFLYRWAYPANPALGDVSIHGTAQADGDL